MKLACFSDLIKGNILPNFRGGGEFYSTVIARTLLHTCAHNTVLYYPNYHFSIIIFGFPIYIGTQDNVQAVINSHQMELQSWLNQFDQFLPRAEIHGGLREEPTLAECEAMWEVISEDDVMVMSLERIHDALVRWSRGSDSSGGHGFNPQGEYNNVPTMEVVDNIEWKGILLFLAYYGAHFMYC